MIKPEWRSWELPGFEPAGQACGVLGIPALVTGIFTEGSLVGDCALELVGSLLTTGT